MNATVFSKQSCVLSNSLTAKTKRPSPRSQVAAAASFSNPSKSPAIFPRAAKNPAIFASSLKTHSVLFSKKDKLNRVLKTNAVTYEGEANYVGDGKFGIVVSRFNDLVTKSLLEGALAGLKRFGVADDNIVVSWVPGSFELPVIAKGMAKSGKFDAVICIGAVIRGSTSHYDAVVSGATSGVLHAGEASGIPVIFGVLTCDNMEQALDRAGGKLGNKGFEFAVTAIEMANLMKDLRENGLMAEPWA